MDADVIQVFMTTDSEQEAQTIARTLVEDGLAACVQVTGPIGSTYRWQGQLETSREWLCLIKSRGALYAELEAAIKRMHSYDVPEILAVPVVSGNEAYLQWLRDATPVAPA